MREETKRRLERELRLHTLKMVAVGLAIVGAVVAGFFLVDLDAHETTVKRAGTIASVETFAGKGALDGLEVGVTLDDGHRVKVLANRARNPRVGDHIDIVEHRHSSGRTTYTMR
ncbi:MAG: hypothetical protein AB7E80_10660 [Hyphomicrobiaceae bacterium]